MKSGRLEPEYLVFFLINKNKPFSILIYPPSVIIACMVENSLELVSNDQKF